MQIKPKATSAAGLHVPHNRYTDEDKAAALAYLQANGGAVNQTARELGIPLSTLKTWATGQFLGPKAVEIYRTMKESLSSKLEDVVHQMVDAMPEKIPEASLRDLGATVGVLVDKMRPLREEPTEITESLNRKDLLEHLIERTMEEFPGTTREEVIDIIRDVKPEAIKFPDLRSGARSEENERKSSHREMAEEMALCHK